MEEIEQTTDTQLPILSNCMDYEQLKAICTLEILAEIENILELYENEMDYENCKQCNMGIGSDAIDWYVGLTSTPDFITDGEIVEVKGWESDLDKIKYQAVDGIHVLYYE